MDARRIAHKVTTELMQALTLARKLASNPNSSTFDAEAGVFRHMLVSTQQMLAALNILLSELSRVMKVLVRVVT